MDSIKSDGLYWNPDPRIDADPLVTGEELKAFQAACGHTWKCSKCAATPPTNPSDAANAAARNAVEELKRDYLLADPTQEELNEVAAIITRHFPQSPVPSVSDAIDAVERLYDEWWDIDRRRWLNVVLERLRALEPKTAAATTSPEKVPNYALVRLLNAAMMHPEQAEGYIRQVIAELDDDSPETPATGDDEGEK